MGGHRSGHAAGRAHRGRSEPEPQERGASSPGALEVAGGAGARGWSSETLQPAEAQSPSKGVGDALGGVLFL